MSSPQTSFDPKQVYQSAQFDPRADFDISPTTSAANALPLPGMPAAPNPLDRVVGYDAAGPIKDGFNQRVGARIKGNFDAPAQVDAISQTIKELGPVDEWVKHLKEDTPSHLKENLSALYQQVKDYVHNPAAITGDVISGAVMHGISPEIPKAAKEEAPVAAKVAEPVIATPEPSAPPSIGNSVSTAARDIVGKANQTKVGRTALKIARHLPYGVGTVVKAGEAAAEFTPEAAAAPKVAVPVEWGQGQHGTPISQWGARIPEQEGPSPTAPTYRDATLNRRNVPEFAGDETPPPLQPTGPVYRDATVNRRNVPEFAGEEIPDKSEPPATPQGQFTHQVDAKSLDALKSATSSIVDQVVPSSTNRGVNLWTKAQIELKLRSGDVAGAEKVLDQAGARSTPSYMAPERPEIVPATQNIRENDSLVAGAERSGRRSFQEAQDDAGVAQEMRADLDKHGYKAESEARREFIARNSHGTTKGEMAGAVKTTEIPAESLSLQEQLQLMLDAARRAQPKTK